MRNYKTNKDYERLKWLLDRGCKVVCFATYTEGGLCLTDCCYGELCGSTYRFFASGIEYCAYGLSRKGYRSFEEMCQKYQIEFIEPDIL